MLRTCAEYRSTYIKHLIFLRLLSHATTKKLAIFLCYLGQIIGSREFHDLDLSGRWMYSVPDIVRMIYCKLDSQEFDDLDISRQIHVQ